MSSLAGDAESRLQDQHGPRASMPELSNGARCAGSDVLDPGTEAIGEQNGLAG
jgi:hypothetical protein